MRVSETEYYPIVDTLRLYAGWLLAFLAVIFAAGSYQHLRILPFEASIIDEWSESGLLLQVTFLTFLFLLFSEIHRALGRGLWKGLFLTMIGFVLFVAFRVNVR